MQMDQLKWGSHKKRGKMRQADSLETDRQTDRETEKEAADSSEDGKHWFATAAIDFVSVAVCVNRINI